ncbi:MAG: sugar isomerase domain-containing protein [Lentisphaeria bacterium]|nr:sugar isomerase domain-containing protein [Lentisphaeria bacterium]
MNRIIGEYLDRIETLLGQAAADTAGLEKAAEMIADAYAAGRTIYIFGCTHSGLLAEDVFYRAGSPAFWRPLWGPGMDIASTPGLLTSAAERNEQLGRSVIECSQLGKDDVLTVISTSGKNAAPVAVAETALRRGAKVIILTSSEYRGEHGSHSTVPNLWSLKDRALVIDNHVPHGDASICAAGCPMGPVSTVIGSFLLHSISALAVEKIAAKGLTPPVFLSSNTAEGKEHNEKLLRDPKLRDAFLLP